jgi:hypothetical protein
MAELAGRQKKPLIKVFLNSFFEYTCFLALLKNCENVVLLLHYIKQRLLWIILCLTLIIFQSVILYGQVLLKKAAMYGVKKSSFWSGTEKFVCFRSPKIYRIDWGPNHSLIQKEKSLSWTGRVEVGSQTFQASKKS